MQSIEIRQGVQVEIGELISGVSKLETPALEKFLDTLSHILDDRKTAASEREIELLEKIENVVPSFVKGRYAQLHASQEEGNLSETERLELQQIIDFMEEKAADLST